ncbi:MAG: hypothetical protein AABZ47_10100, partial [Planctomycetota bacterium]
RPTMTIPRLSRDFHHGLLDNGQRQVWPRRDLLWQARSVRRIGIAINAVHKDILGDPAKAKPGRRLDEVLLIWGGRCVGWLYRSATSIVLVHALAWVGKKTRAQRREACRLCPMRQAWNPQEYEYIAPDQASVGKNDFCVGVNQGCGCGCPKTPLWPPSRLRYKLWLRNFGCPLRKFGRRLDRAKMESDLN